MGRDELSNSGQQPEPVALTAMSDAALAAEVERELAALSPRARVFALSMGAGSTAVVAASEAKLSLEPAAISRQKKRTTAVQRLLREQHRRQTLFTREAAVLKFRLIAEQARQARDFNAAVKALREAALLCDHYPDVRLKLEHSVNPREVSADEWQMLALLRHRVRDNGDVIDAQIATPADATPLLPAAAVTESEDHHG